MLAAALLAAATLAQQAPGEPELLAFHAQSNLVILPFQVSRNKHFATDLSAGDVVLLEDGVPRKFSVFEGPQEHTPVELLLLFDTTTWPMGGRWNLQALYGFTARWTDSNASAFVASGVQAVRASVYHFDGVRLARLCQPTTDPSRLADALRHLLDPIRSLDLTPDQRTQISIAMEAASDGMDRKALEARFRTTDRTPPSGTPIPLDLPPGGSILPARAWPGTGSRGWPFEAAIGTLKDAAAESGKALRVLVEFSQGVGGTTTSAADVADHALSLGVSVYPVVLNYRFWFGGRGSQPGDDAPEQAFGRGGGGAGPRYNSPADNFARLGSLTGGRSFTPADLNADEFAQILDAVRKEALDRAGSQYTVGFTPQSSAGQAREHKLEVRLAAKSSGKVSGGKRKVIY
jgi:hypothetical protein